MIASSLQVLPGLTRGPLSGSFQGHSQILRFSFRSRHVEGRPKSAVYTRLAPQTRCLGSLYKPLGRRASAFLKSLIVKRRPLNDRWQGNCQEPCGNQKGGEEEEEAATRTMTWTEFQLAVALNNQRPRHVFQHFIRSCLSLWFMCFILIVTTVVSIFSSIIPM